MKFLRILPLSFVVGVICMARESLPQDTKISVDFPDEYRAVIVRNVAELYGLNLSMPSDFSNEKVSFILKNVTWEQIYDVCFYGSGYTYVKSGDVVQVVKLDNDVKVVSLLREKLYQETKETQAFRLLLIQLIEEGAVDCDPKQRADVCDFVRNVNNSAEDCLATLREARSKRATMPTPVPVAPATTTPVPRDKGAAHL